VASPQILSHHEANSAERNQSRNISREGAKKKLSELGVLRALAGKYPNPRK
jgi:hypothetical protein